MPVRSALQDVRGDGGPVGRDRDRPERGVLPLLVQFGHRRQEHPGVVVLRVAEDLPGRPHLHDRTLPHDDRPVAHVVAERQVVGDEQDRQARPLQLDQEVEHVDARGGVEHADDLVGDQHLDLQQQRAGDQQPLLLAAGKLVRVLAEHVAGVERYRVKRRIDLVVPVLVRDVREVHVTDQSKDPVRPVDGVVGAERVLEDALHMPVVVAQPALGVAGDVRAVEGHRAAGRLDEPQDDLADRGLAAAALADQGDDLALVQLEADLPQRRGQTAGPAGRPEQLGDLVHLQRAHVTSSLTFQHATWCPGFTSSKGGVSVHLANANGHLSRKRHPAGGLTSDGGRPGMPVSVVWSCRTPTSGSDAISALVYGCSGSFTIVSVLAFSASRPAYMIAMVSAICARMLRSCVIVMALLMNSRSRNSSSISPTARWVETSSAEVTSSAMSSDGFSSVEMMIVTRCRMPPDISKEYLLSTSSLSPISAIRRFISARTSSWLRTPCDLSRSLVSLPIFLVGGSALIAYCGTSETSLIRSGRMALVSVIGSSLPSSLTLPPVCFILGSR